MTVHRVTELRCDRDACDNAYAWDGNAATVRAHARDTCGWIVAQPGGVDYCSTTCRDQSERTRP